MNNQTHDPAPGVISRFAHSPRVILALVVLAGLFAALQARSFTFDASADTLVVEGDANYEYFIEMIERFGQSSFLVMTYTPDDGQLFSPDHLGQIEALQHALDDVPGVRSTLSLLDAPLLRSPPISLAEMAEDYRTLRAGTADLTLAKKELRESALFSELLISKDGNSALIQINLEPETSLEKLRKARDQLRASSDPADAAELTRVSAQYRDANELYKQQQALLIEAIRNVRRTNSTAATIHLGGVPMVAADMIAFVRGDTTNFGGAILLLIALTLWYFFRQARWIVLPIITTAVAMLWTIGVLGYLKQPVTVVSSSFIPLLAIITISFNVHLIVRYGELIGEADHRTAVLTTLRSKFAPCVYTALTTMVAFASLMTSGIKPVSDFGWMMCVGIALSLLATYSIYASLLVLMPAGSPQLRSTGPLALTGLLRDWVLHRPKTILFSANVTMVVSVLLTTQVSLDNRFVDYFKSGTDIREGMIFIDRQLGGTIPLDVIISFAPFEDTDIDDDPFAEPEDDPFPEKYWFTEDKLRTLEQMHTYLESIDEIGKVVSVTTLEHEAREFNDGKPLSNLVILAVLELIPNDIRQTFIDPYASPRSGEMRISMRVHETHPDLNRDELFRKISDYAENTMGLAPERVRISGMTVLFNDMLKKMFSSQASTLIFVVIATTLMFSLLLRSAWLGIVGVAPNILAPTMILGVMGATGIPLDMMTITIAAIVIGIGVDDAIHYLHRYHSERAEGATVADAITASHGSIGSAMYFTSLTIMCGFSVLALSNFIPTIYFGLLTALAMAVALIANLTVLPAMLISAPAAEQSLLEVLRRRFS